MSKTKIPLIVENDELRELLIASHKHIFQLLSLAKLVRSNAIDQEVLPELICSLGNDLGHVMERVTRTIEMDNALEELHMIKGNNLCLH